MLDSATKRRIVTARDILVGKVPDPKSQVEQITIALIYKFMDDMDAESEEFGGARKFFAGDFARYGWAKLMRSGLGGHEALALYAEAITKMPENPGIPPLFRDIFKNAYLPYRDPETLRAFLKVIDEFEYDHSERLGDAFEYLLSVLGAQGGAGQFRTPRHIIDFMVAVIDPKKDEAVLDPACGTAGFLISSWKHILRANTDPQGHSTLTPDDRARLAQNFKGYDISPDMVRLSLVNLYLHGFTDPHIYEYDTLTSQERWNERADVILANPPFMSPKGGIKPHNGFSIPAKRSEVLFVDYMAAHLTPGGRAAIIVPEGIIFQSQTAYKRLRKLLVDDYLVAVVSLPAGCFNPYSGVKTSILFLDKALAKQAGTVAFFKVENDGFGLGAQRRAIEKNDLPQVQAELAAYLSSLRNPNPAAPPAPSSQSAPSGQSATSCQSASSPQSAPSDRSDSSHPSAPLSAGRVVPKEKIAANGDYNLSGERYRENRARTNTFPHVTLGEVTIGKPQYGSGARKVPYDGSVRYVRITDISEGGELKPDNPVSPSVTEPENFLAVDDLLIARSGSVGRAYLHRKQPGTFQYAGYLIRFRLNPDMALPAYVYRAVNSPTWWDWISSNSKTGTLTNINAQQYGSFEFPLPPLEVQREIVAEIEGYQKVIDGARAVLDHYKPHIPIHPDWPMVELGEVVSFSSGGTPAKSNSSYWGGDIPWISAKDMKSDKLSDSSTHVSIAALRETATRVAPVGSLLILVRGMGLANGVPICELTKPCAFNQDVKAMNPNDCVNPTFLRLMLNQEAQQLQKIIETAAHGTLKLSSNALGKITFPLPPLAAQQSIVAEIEAEQALVNANRELIARMEKKIQATLARVWGEGGGDTAG